MADPPTSYEDGGASDHESLLRIRLRPVSGARVLGWLLHADQLHERADVRLESFEESTAIVSVDPTAMGTLVRLLAGDGWPPPNVELLPGSSPPTAEAPPAVVGVEAAHSPAGHVMPGAGPPPSRRSRRLLWIVALIVAAALAAAAGFAAGWLLRAEDEEPPVIDQQVGDLTAIVPAITATPPPSTPSRARLARDLSGACIPETGASQCDAVRAALWVGDPAAWRDWAIRRGEPPPAAAEATSRAIGLRLAAADPAARIAFARVTSAPLPLIAALHVEWRDGRATLRAVEIANLGVRAIDLSGGVPGLGSLTGSALPPGDRCALGTGVDVPACAGTIDAVPNEFTTGGRVRLIGADGQELDQVSMP